MYRSNKLYEAITMAVASGAVGVSGSALAQDDAPRRLEEVVVTAAKRTENLQDVPISVQAMDQEMLENADIQSFEDWVKHAPNVNFAGRGPGQNAVFMRGITAGGGIYQSGRVGSTSSVAFYLDEVAMTTTGRNIDVHLVDVSRIEVLPGPQGTLYGQSSQAGTIRVITNKPEMNEFGGKVQFTGHTIHKGEAGWGLEGHVNIPIIEDRLALRVVGYEINRGGWIDNVPGTISFADNMHIANRAVADDAVLHERNNFDRAEDDFNTTLYRGGRITASLHINEDWDLTAGVMAQDLEVDGVFDHVPSIGDLKTSRYEGESLDDEFIQFNWSLDGRLGWLDVVYNGAYIEQDVIQHADYTTNVYDTSWLIFYNCAYSASPREIQDCEAPNETFHLYEEKSRMQHELRFTTDPTKPLRFIGGIWYTDSEVLALQEWKYHRTDLFAQNAAFPGARTFFPPRPPETAFWNEILQEEEELSFFGELTYDVTDWMSATFGVRRSIMDVKPWGSFNTATLGPVDGAGGGTLDGFDATEKQTVFKGTVTVRPNQDMMFFATYSEGFRRGGFNRQGAVFDITTGEQAFPAFFNSDLVDNYEIGWKTQLFDNRLRFNGSAYFLDWSDQQIGILDPPKYGITAFTANLAGSEIWGVEGDFTALLTNNLTMTGAFTFLDGEITELPETGAESIRPVGSELSRVPTFSGNLNFRYDFLLNGIDSFATFGMQHTGAMTQGIGATDSEHLSAYTLFDASVGMNLGQWQARLLGSNLTDARPELSINRNDPDAFMRIRSARPRTLSFRVSYSF